MSFNKKEYDKTKKQWKVDLPIEEKEEYDEILNLHGIAKIDFLRNSFKKFKEELKMKRYIIDYEEEILKETLTDEKESTYEYLEGDRKVYETLEEAQKEFDKFESEVYYNQTNRKWLKKIATLYETEMDENGEFGDLEAIDTK